jgi:molybdopterin molybdotransferase
MLTVAEALELVRQNSTASPPVAISTDDALGLTLAENIISDIDSPPWDKSMVDGHAIRVADLPGGVGELTLLEEIHAGAVPTQSISPGVCSRIMTGAPIPAGAEAVVMLEQTEIVSPTRIRFNDPRLRAGQNIMRQGASLRRGETVLEEGRTIRPIEIGLLAEVGRISVVSVSRPRVAILSTGNELVPPDVIPSGSQIRNSNGPLLAAAVRRAGAVPIELGICRDDADSLREKIAIGLQADILVLSGGVSAGVLDLVPNVLAELGIEKVFHKVQLKPGKPIWFGRASSPSHALVFGLPGNPVSSCVCFELFVRLAIARLSGRQAVVTFRARPARLAAEFTHRGDRPTYFPALLQFGDGANGDSVTPLRWAGSADLRGFAAANALIAFPAGDRVFATDETVDVLPLDE